MPMSAPEDQVTQEPTDMLLHDLRRFLHDARDQHEILLKILESMTNASARFEGQEAVVKRVFQTLKHQVETGITVHVDADLRAHAARVAASTAPLASELEQTRKVIRRLSIMIVSVSLIGGFIGGLAGVLVALQLL